MDLEDMYKGTIPPNLRLLLSTAFGSRQPITEKDFHPNDLAALRKAAMAGHYDHENDLESLRVIRDMYSRMDRDGIPAAYTLVPDIGPNGEYRGVKQTNIVSAAQRMQEYEKQLQRKQRSFGNIQYNHYGKQTADAIDETGWYDTTKKSFSDPNFRMATSLGRARLEKDPQGNLIVRDEYSFHGMRPEIQRPTMLLDYLMRSVAPKGKGRDVRINLGPTGENDGRY